MSEAETRPCEYCQAPVTKTKAQQSQRKYWTCNASCANKLRIARGHVPLTWSDNPLRGQRETRPCAVCGTPVTRRLSQRRTAQTWTCSRTCQGIANTRKRMAEGTWTRPTKPQRGDTVACQVCGQLFYRNPGEIARNRVLCSRECNARSQTKQPVVKACGWCGKELRLKPSQGSIQYCSKACEGEARIQRPLDRTHNGRRARLTDTGYVMVWEPTHPNATKGWVYEHRLVAESTTGRYLERYEQVHHLNGIKTDNRSGNLQVMHEDEHAALSARDYKNSVTSAFDELAEYRRRFGPLQ